MVIQEEELTLSTETSRRTTPAESIDYILRRARAGVRDAEIIKSFNADGMKTALGGPLRFTTLQRIKAAHGLHEPRTPDAIRFWFRVVCDVDTRCNIWNGRMHEDGYGLAEVGGRNVLAHRYAYGLKHPIPAGHALHHSCGNRRCVSTAHVRPVADPAEHKALERAEAAVSTAIQAGAFEAERRTFPQVSDREATLARVGALRPSELLS